jgi:hypothetical protein
MFKMEIVENRGLVADGWSKGVCHGLCESCQRAFVRVVSNGVCASLVKGRIANRVIDRVDTSRCAISVFVFSWLHQVTDRVDTSRCAISVFVFSWPENHNMHHRTSSIVASQNCVISGPLLNEEHHHTWVLEFGQAITISCFRIEMIQTKLW